MGKKKTISNTNSKEKIYSKQKQNPIDYIFLKIRKKKQFKKRSMVGYFKVRRKNSKLQSKLIMWARKKI